MVRCPYCSEDSDKVVDSRASVDGDAIRRRRECLECGRRFTTYERLEPIPLTVRKRSGVTEPFDRDKLARGLAQAVAGRAVAAEAVEALAGDLAEWAESQGPEIASDAIGVAVLERLRDPRSGLVPAVRLGVQGLRGPRRLRGRGGGAPARATPAPGPRAEPLEKTTAPKTPEPERR